MNWVIEIIRHYVGWHAYYEVWNFLWCWIPLSAPTRRRKRVPRWLIRLDWLFARWKSTGSMMRAGWGAILTR